MLSNIAFKRLCRARDRLCAAPLDRLSVHAVAREAGMSTYHFIRQFDALFGATPHQLRITARIERAKGLLALRDHSVTQVCLEVGFSSLGSFSTLFARRVGVAPSAYRRQVRALVRDRDRPSPALHPGCLMLMAGPEGLAIFEKHQRRALSHCGITPSTLGRAKEITHEDQAG